MSSNDDDFNEGETAQPKAKRITRACDMCRRKKRRCNGREPCDHCEKHDFPCTYIEPSMVRPAGPGGTDQEPSSSYGAHSQSYVQALEERLRTVEELLAKAKSAKSPGVVLISNAINRLNSPFPAPHADDLAFTEIGESFRALSIDHPAAQGFQGKSSGAMLVKAAVDLWNGKNRNSKQDATAQETWTANPNVTTPWTVPSSLPAYSFPEDDLLASLIALYFDNVNPFLPLLHRPTFEQAVAQQLHNTHRGFAQTVLLVCAVASRYSSDPRVSIPDMPAAETAGWKWYDQVELSGHLIRSYPTLYDLQAYCLAAEFLDCTSSPRTCWTLVGFGMRLSQDAGAHRHKMRRTVSFEQELEKRASWVLYLFDSQISTALGRSIALQSHDFDIELPIVCDDEYWGTPQEPSIPLFNQPFDKPARLAYFGCMLQLNRILSFSCKILYATNRSKVLIGLGDDKWEEQVVVELDSALNKWYETIPPHLRWDPENPIEDDTFFDQSAVLYCTYYHTRIVIHRPFIPAMRRVSNPTHLPSLAICNNAARACSHVAQIQQQRRPNNPLWFSQTPLFTSGIVLLLNIWGGAGTSSITGVGRVKAVEADLADVHRCMAVLDIQQKIWPSAGALLYVDSNQTNIYGSFSRRNTLRQLVASDHPLAASPAPEQGQTAPLASAPVPAQIITTPSHFTLEPPQYDQHLETAPPDNYLADVNANIDVDVGYDSGYAPRNFDPDTISGGPHTQVYDGQPLVGSFASTQFPYTGNQMSDYANQHGPELGLGYDASGGYAQDWSGYVYADGQPYNMELDTHTIDLWSRAPTSFGVADWDMYLGRAVDDIGEGMSEDTFEMPGHI